MKQLSLPYTLLIFGITLAFSGCTTAQPALFAPETPTAVPSELPAANEPAPTFIATLPAPASPAPPPTVALDDFGPAPELHNETWLNTAAPLRLAELRGQVVLLDMWTFG